MPGLRLNHVIKRSPVFGYSCEWDNLLVCVTCLSVWPHVYSWGHWTLGMILYNTACYLDLKIDKKERRKNLSLYSTIYLWNWPSIVKHSTAYTCRSLFQYKYNRSRFLDSHYKDRVVMRFIFIMIIPILVRCILILRQSTYAIHNVSNVWWHTKHMA